MLGNNTGLEDFLLGRVWAYALAGGGEAGVAHMLQLEAEMRVAMALTGVTSIGAITRDILVQGETWPHRALPSLR